MSFVAGSIVGTMAMDESPTIRAFKNVETASRSMKGKVEEAMGQAGAGGAKGFISSLKAEFGKGSLFGQITKLALGGGAIAGFVFAAKEIARLTQAGIELLAGTQQANEAIERQQKIFDALTKSAKDYREALAKLNAEMPGAGGAKVAGGKAFEAAGEARSAQQQAINQITAARQELKRQSDLFDIPFLRRTLDEQKFVLTHDRAQIQGDINSLDQQLGILNRVASDKNLENIQKARQVAASPFALGPPANPEAAKAAEAMDPIKEFAASLEKLQAAKWMQLPNARLQAEQVYGFKTVTSADLPSPFVNAAMNTEKNTKITADAVTQLKDRFSSGPMPSGMTINTVTMP